MTLEFSVSETAGRRKEGGPELLKEEPSTTASDGLVLGIFLFPEESENHEVLGSTLEWEHQGRRRLWS